MVEALRKGATQVAAGRGVSGSSSRAVRVRRLVRVQTCNSCWGGSRAGARASGWAGRPRWVRISAVTNDEKTQATTRRLPPHLPHVKRSTDQVLFNSSAQGILLEGGGVAGPSTELVTGCSSRDGIEGGAVGGGTSGGRAGGAGSGTTSGRKRALGARHPKKRTG